MKALATIMISLLILSCGGKDGSSSDERVSISGTITLQGETDFSGIDLKLYIPDDLDTTLTNVNSQYPSIALTLDHLTEFYWQDRTHYAQTLSAADGSFEFTNLPDDAYHLVVQMDGFGWQVKLNVREGSHDIELTPELVLQGNYTNDMTIETGTFVRVAQTATFEPGTHLNIEPGVIFEVEGNSRLEAQGYINCDGSASDPVYFVAPDAGSNNTARLRLQNSNHSIIRNAVFFNLGNGIQLLSSDTVTVEGVRIARGDFGIDLFDSQNVTVRSCFISDTENGVQSNLSKMTLESSAIVNCTENGVESVDENGSTLRYNVIKNAAINGISIDRANFITNISWNDFIGNDTHIRLLIDGRSTVNSNNFLREGSELVFVQAHTNTDTLDYSNNYWGYDNTIDIQNLMTDQSDRVGNSAPGMLINFNPHHVQYIPW